MALLVAGMAGAEDRAEAAVVWAVGDGAGPWIEDDQLAARIQSEGLDRFLYLGDVYESGTAREYRAGYHPSFGRFRLRSYPTPGNHEWGHRREGYDPYWGRRAPRSGGGHYYSFNFAAWHFVSLNSEEPSGTGSAQRAWLRRDLAGYTGTCTLAFSHRPRYSAGRHGDTPALEPLWSELAGNAVALLSGHDHDYQRFKASRGVVQLVAGTGGKARYDVSERDLRLNASSDEAFGALRLRLSRGRLGWDFVPIIGSALDAGALGCRPHETRARVRITLPATGRTYGRGPRLLEGFARATRVRPRLTLVRRIGRRCAVFNGHRFVGSGCATNRSVAAPGVRHWRLRLWLRGGRYRLTTYARGLDGRLVWATSRFGVR